MSNNILQDAFLSVSDDEKFVRITTLTTIIHSMIIILLILYNTNNLLTYIFGTGVEMKKLLSYATVLFSDASMATVSFIAFLMLIVWHFLLYPVGEATMIFYLNNQDRSSSKAFFSWIAKFFPMFEFSALNGIGFNFLSYAFIVGRIYMMGILFDPLMMILLGIRFLVILSIMFLWPYVKFLIVLEWYDVTSAMKKSISLSLTHFGITLKFMMISFLLQLRFLVNVIVTIAIPVGIMRAAIQFNLVNNLYVDTIIYASAIAIILITGYINAIIEAFFMTYRRKVYQMIRTDSI